MTFDKQSNERRIETESYFVNTTKRGTDQVNATVLLTTEV